MRIIHTLLLLGLINFGYSSDYFPLEIGNRWVWKSYPSINETPGEISLEIVRDSIVGDTTFLIYYQTCLMNGFDCGSFYDVLFFTELNPNSVYAFDDTTAVVIFQHDFQESDSTFIYGENVKVEFIGDLSVAAGTFTSCFKLGNNVFAPNIGLIASCWDDNCDEPFQQELLEYNIASNTNNAWFKNDRQVKVYPNPSKDYITIKYQNCTIVKQIKIIGIEGTTVFESKDSLTQIDLSYLKSGIYYLILDFYDNSRQTHKIFRL